MLRQIDVLNLSKIRLDEDVAYAISKRKIQTINLDEVELTEKGIKRLVNMRDLFRVSISLCKFKLEWLDEIRSRNPSIIYASPKAFLGVQGPRTGVVSPERSGCQISEVVPDTAAAKAGMQPMDIVTAMDGTKISKFEDLRLLIAQKSPGDSMLLDVKRGAKMIKLKVELGKMDQPLR